MNRFIGTCKPANKGLLMVMNLVNAVQLKQKKENNKQLKQV